MKAAYLMSADPLFIVYESSMMLKAEFGKKNVDPVWLEELHRSDLSDCDLLFLPGIPGEVSPYPDIMTPQVKAMLFNEVRRGMILWTDCAATYEMMTDMEFHASSGEIKQRKGLGWIDGMARGPVSGHAIAPAPSDRFQHVTLKEIFYRVRGEQRSAWAGYGNGPGLILSDEERRNPDVQIIGRYGPDDSSPAAAVTKKIGHGLLMSLGVLIQMEPASIQGQPTLPSRDVRDTAAQHRTKILEKLQETDPSRRAFLNHLMEIVRTHYQGVQRKAGISSAGLLKLAHE